MTKLQITELLRQHHPHLSSKQSDMYLEQAADDICGKTFLHRRTDIMSSVAGQRYYSFPKQAIKIERVWFNDVEIPRLIGEPIIDDDEFATNALDTADTALATPTANASNKRFWYVSPYPQRTEFVTSSDESGVTDEVGNIAEERRERIGIVEKVNNAVTRDGRTSNFQSCSITGTYNIRVAGVWTPERFQSDDDPTKDWVGPLTAIPKQYHEVMLNGAIARGYKDPSNFKAEMYQFFNNEFELGMKEIKKFVRTRTGTGFIRPQDF